MVTKVTPHWDAVECESPKEYVVAIALEGVSRLLLQPTEGEQDKIVEAVRQAMGTERGSSIEKSMLYLAVEAARLGVLLGYAIANTGLADSYEGALRRTIRAAGLAGYRPRQLSLAH